MELVKPAEGMDSGTHRLISERNVAERKLVAIAKAITEHRVEQRRKPYPTRAEDFHLYRRAGQILGYRVEGEPRN